MLAATTTLGTIMLVLSFLSGALDLSPIGNVSASEVDEDTPFSTEVVEQTAGKVGTMYNAIIVDIASFADNPDMELAQSRLDDMNGYASTLAGRYESFAEALQDRLETATSPSEA